MAMIWFESKDQLGFSVVLPDGRELSVDLRRKGYGSVLLVNSDGTAENLWDVKDREQSKPANV